MNANAKAQHLHLAIDSNHVRAIRRCQINPKSMYQFQWIPSRSTIVLDPGARKVCQVFICSESARSV